MARRSTDSAGSRLGAPCTWQRNPRLAYSSAREMPDLASRRLARTSWVLLPMDETMPIPVTTTRLMIASSAFPARKKNGQPAASGSARLCRFLAEQSDPDLQIECPIDNGAIDREPPVRDAER